MRYLLEKVCLVIPCYNEAKRLDFEKFKVVKSNCYFLFVNDSSKDDTLDVIKENMTDNMYVLNLTKNVGKGEAVRRGMLYLKTLPIFQEIEWAGYWDADLSTPLDELNNFFLYAKTFPGKIDSIWGSRIFKLGCNIKRSFMRHFLGRLFSVVIGIFLKVESYDSQCGAKLIRKELLDISFLEPFISRWIFDLEILLRLEGYNIIECPLKNWTRVPGSKLRVSSVAFRTLLEIFKIRKKYGRNSSQNGKTQGICDKKLGKSKI